MRLAHLIDRLAAPREQQVFAIAKDRAPNGKRRPNRNDFGVDFVLCAIGFGLGKRRRHLGSRQYRPILVGSAFGIANLNRILAISGQVHLCAAAPSWQDVEGCFWREIQNIYAIGDAHANDWNILRRKFEIIRIQHGMAIGCRQFDVLGKCWGNIEAKGQGDDGDFIHNRCGKWEQWGTKRKSPRRGVCGARKLG